MSIESYILNPPKNVYWIEKNWNTLNFEMSFQRKYGRWSQEKKSRFIHTMLYGFRVPPVFCVENDTSEQYKYDFIDGLQRMGCIHEYVNNEFVLHENTPEFEGEVLAGKKFDDLSKDLQKQIENWCPQMIVFKKGITEEEIEEQFERLNQGESFTPMELTRARIGSQMRSYLGQIADSNFFRKICFSEKDLQTYIDEALALQILTFFVGEEIDFSNKELKNFGVGLKNEGVSQEVKDEVNSVLEFLDKAFPNSSADSESFVRTPVKVLKKIHIPSIVKVAYDLIDEETNPEAFGMAVRSFLETQDSLRKDYNKSKKAHEKDEKVNIVYMGKYNEACSGGTAKRDSIQTRNDELGGYVYNYLEESKNTRLVG